MSNFLVILTTDAGQTEAGRRFRTAVDFAASEMGQRPARTLESDWARVASFPRRNGTGAPLVTDPASGAWLVATGTWFHADGSGPGAEGRLLARYLEVGPERLGRELEGFFAIAVGDPRSHDVVVLTDLVGSCHCFARAWEGGVALSGSSLLLASLAEWRLDPVGCQEFLCTGVSYEDRTLYRDVRKLGPASVHRFTASGPRGEQRYWRLTDVAPESLDGPAAVEALGEALVRVARNVAAHAARPVCDLTGGYDSRAVVALFRTAGVPFTTAVAGPADSPDVVVSRGLARLAGLPHVHLPPTPVTFERVKRALPLTDGEYDLVEYARILDVHERLAERFDFCVNGSLGELARGYWWELLMPRAGARSPLDASLVARRRLAAVPCDTLLFPPGQRLDLAAHFADVIRRNNAGLSDLPNTLQMDHVYLMMRMQRWQGRIASSTNRLWPGLQPFLCRPVAEAVLRAGAGVRRRSLLTRLLLARYQPEMAAFPLEHGYPALPFTLRSAHRFAPLLPRYAAKGARKLLEKFGGRNHHRAPAPPATRLRLWEDEEVRELLDPARMLLGALADVDAVGAFLRRSREPAFAHDGQWARLLTLEYTLRVLARVREPARQPVYLAAREQAPPGPRSDARPVLLAVVDTEEEFDWSAPFSPAHRSVGHVARLPRLHALFERYGVRPTYLVDHPIATTPESVRVLDGFLRRGTCEVGAHLHPWVNPPLVEDCTSRNSYLSNLPLPLQQDKLAELTAVIRRAFGVAPASFRAGRHGLDCALVPTLRELGYRVDSSVRAFVTFEQDGGPSFEEFGPEPFWLDDGTCAEGPPLPRLLEVPATVGFTRRPLAWWAAVHRRLSRRPWNRWRLIGVLWHLGVVRKQWLSPEGSSLADQLGLLRALAREPRPVLNLSLHSPSVEPGHTPYVRSEADLERLLAVLEGVLDFAVGRLGARCLTLGEFQAEFPAAGPSLRIPGRGPGNPSLRPAQPAELAGQMG